MRNPRRGASTPLSPLLTVGSDLIEKQTGRRTVALIRVELGLTTRNAFSGQIDAPIGQTNTEFAEGRNRMNENARAINSIFLSARRR